MPSSLLPAEDAVPSLRGSVVFKKLVLETKVFETFGQVDDLLQAAHVCLSVDGAVFVPNPDDVRLRRSSELSPCCLQSLEDVLVVFRDLCVRDEFGFHGSLSLADRRILRYGVKLLSKFCPPPVNSGAPASVARPGSSGRQGGTLAQSARMSMGFAVFGKASSGTSTHLKPGGASAGGMCFLGTFRRGAFSLSYSSRPSLMAAFKSKYVTHAVMTVATTVITKPDRVALNIISLNWASQFFISFLSLVAPSYPVRFS